MELRDVLYQMMQRNAAAMQPTDLCVGTVVSAAPLQVSLSAQTAPLEGAQLLLTEPVVEKKIPVLTHIHEMEGLSHTHTLSGLGHSHDTTGFAHSHTTGGLSHAHTLSEGQTGAALAGSYSSDEQLAGTFSSDQKLTGTYTTSGALGDVEMEGALSGVQCIENGQPLPVEDGYIILNRALAAGDKVLLLRVERGARYIVLSRMFEGV
ncbi:MAG TPA: DUF2577 family protein [Candidatus Ventrousia excrementavium]|uniref:DUF2577 family protein n=1 Tax=Candidatus Ventrousia excrementavium TaxID=2840961 RepID=A0A9D1IUZ6_9CLOT|nr:DUF2577 family protein [Candidatus Ventrousia excrementavium]